MCKPSRLEVDQHELYKVWSKISLSPRTITSSILNQLPLRVLVHEQLPLLLQCFWIDPCVHLQFPASLWTSGLCRRQKSPYELTQLSFWESSLLTCRHYFFFPPKLCRCCNFSHRLRVSMQSCTAISWSVKRGRPLETASANIQSCTR